MVDCELLIVGAGPHALALTLRLLCKMPHSTYTDEQHQRMVSWKNRINGPSTGKSKRGPLWLSPKSSAACSDTCCNTTQLAPNMESVKISNGMVVVDPAGEWMARWNSQFDAYHIEQLRSPAFFHPDPMHSDALKAYAELHGRQNELSECQELFDRAVKKGGVKRLPDRSLFNERDRINFLIPSSRLFQDFCRDLVREYALQHAVTKGKVVDIDPVVGADGRPTCYNVSVELPTGVKIIVARRVASCIGFMNMPRVPQWVDTMREHCRQVPENRIVHSNDLLSMVKNKSADRIPQDIRLRLARHETCHLVVVGGGLTSAHLCILADKLGFKKVTLLTRSHIVVKFFDASLPWVGRYKNIEFSTFYGTRDMKERVAIVRGARQGGSITPEAMNALKELEAQGRLTIRKKTEVCEACWDDQAMQWQLETSADDQLRCDIVWLATGSEMDASKEPLFRRILEKYPVDVTSGFPPLTQDLQWSNTCDSFFVSGGYATLQMGPNALNLNGGRAAADRIAQAIFEQLSETRDESDSENDDEAEGALANAGNYFSLLSIE